MEKKETLKTVENELTKLLNLDKKNWTHFYVLIKKVEDEELWKDNYSSFTQWVKEFAVRTKTHESIIWNRKKAGKVYETYQKIREQQGIETPSIEETNVSADSLVILDKINRYDQEVASKLVDKVINKEITKKDLREVYKSIRPYNISNDPRALPVEKEDRDFITANDIVSTLCNIEWLGLKEKPKRNFFKSAFEQNKYRTFTEFPVYTGTTKKSRRMDMLIAENITSNNTWELNLHCIEIKVSKGDLRHDFKYTEYSPFVDYTWLAIPKQLKEDALKTKFNECGIIVVDEFGAKIEVQAKLIKGKAGDRKIETLNNLSLKLL